MATKLGSRKGGGGAGGVGQSRKTGATKRSRTFLTGIAASSVARRSSSKSSNSVRQSNAPATKGFRDLLGNRGAKR